MTDPHLALRWPNLVDPALLDANYAAIIGDGVAGNQYTATLAQMAAVGGGVVNVRVYATGDGSDETAAIQRAFNAAGSGGTVVFPQNGVFGVGAAGLAITGLSNMTVIGNGSSIKALAVPTQVPANFQATLLYMSGSTNCAITDLLFDANGKLCTMVGLSACTGCEVSGNKFGGGGIASAGVITARGGTGNRITYNEITGATGTGPSMWLGNYGASLMENDILVHGNYVHDTQGDGMVVSAVGGTVSSNRIHTNVIGSGIVFGGANGYATAHLAITGNSVRNVGGNFHGIQSDVVYTTVADVPFDITITGNTVTSGAALASGIFLSTISNFTCTGNICLDSGYGISIERASNGVVSNNVCRDTRSGGSRTQIAGINCVASTNPISDITFANNECSNNTTYGIRVANVAAELITNVSINGNRCTGNGGTGIYVIESTTATVTGIVVTDNLCRTNTTVDIRIDVLDVLIGKNLYGTEQNLQYISFTDADTTPSVLGGRPRFRAANTGATSITTFDDGVNGQEVEIYCSNANTTFVNGTFILQGATNYNAPADSLITFVRLSTTWKERYRACGMIKAAALADLGALATVDTAGASYTATEQGMLAHIKTDLTSIRTEINTLLANRRTAKEQ